MSKKIGSRKLVSSVLTAALTALLLAGGTGVGARQKAKPAGVAARAASVNPKTAAVREATAEVLRETSELRRLPILRPVRSGAQSRAGSELPRLTPEWMTRLADRATKKNNEEKSHAL